MSFVTKTSLKRDDPIVKLTVPVTYALRAASKAMPVLSSILFTRYVE